MNRCAHLQCGWDFTSQDGLHLLPCTGTTGNDLPSVCQATGATDFWYKTAVHIIHITNENIFEFFTYVTFGVADSVGKAEHENFHACSVPLPNSY